mmetsp:Transcript_29831/g.65195  ORF Transcript_29831/g.65195 Transcript_29831/m.65195 type:complete len:254 (-) Transcript_29831:94-855(-)
MSLCVIWPQSYGPPVASQCLLPSVIGPQHCTHLHMRVEVFRHIPRRECIGPVANLRQNTRHVRLSFGRVIMAVFFQRLLEVSQELLHCRRELLRSLCWRDCWLFAGASCFARAGLGGAGLGLGDRRFRHYFALLHGFGGGGRWIGLNWVRVRRKGESESVEIAIHVPCTIVVGPAQPVKAQAPAIYIRPVSSEHLVEDGRYLLLREHRRRVDSDHKGRHLLLRETAIVILIERREDGLHLLGSLRARRFRHPV